MTTFKEDLLHVWQDYKDESRAPETSEGAMPALLINPDTRGYRVRPVRRHNGHDELEPSRVTAENDLESIVLYDESRSNHKEGAIRGTIMVPPKSYRIESTEDDFSARLPRYENRFQIGGVDDKTIIDEAEDEHERIKEDYNVMSILYGTDELRATWEDAMHALQDRDKFNEEVQRTRQNDDYQTIDPFYAAPREAPRGTRRRISRLATMTNKMIASDSYDPLRSHYVTERIEALTSRTD